MLSLSLIASVIFPLVFSSELGKFSITNSISSALPPNLYPGGIIRETRSISGTGFDLAFGFDLALALAFGFGVGIVSGSGVGSGVGIGVGSGVGVNSGPDMTRWQFWPFFL